MASFLAPTYKICLLHQGSHTDPHTSLAWLPAFSILIPK